MNLEILPLAITMMAGPQIMSALVLITSKRPVTNSLAFVAAVAATATAGVFLYSLLGNGLDTAIGLHDNSGPTPLANAIQLALALLLVWLAVRSYRHRATATEPKWMESLANATPKKSFTLAATLIFLMPTDIIVMLTVGVNLASHDLSLAAAWPFLALTTLIAALPLIGYIVFYRRAKVLMPKARDWMSEHSWLVNIFVYLLFIYLVLK